MDPTSIKLPAHTVSQIQRAPEDDEDDESIASESLASESSLDTLNPRLQEMATKINQAFVDYRIGESSLANSNTKVLQIMSHSRGLSVEGYRADLAARLVEWVHCVPLPEIEEFADMILKRESNIPRPVNLSPREVLGRDILEAVWDDMTCTELPSWMSPAPRNWGTATRGKLTADQWKVVATVHLPLTLIRLWGTKEGRYFLLLCNFMDLSAAIQLANQ